jgi:biotin carboxyl carrier protein
MDYKQIQELIKLINKSNIGELSIEEKDFKISIKQKKERDQQTTFVAQPALQPACFGSTNIRGADCTVSANCSGNCRTGGQNR